MGMCLHLADVSTTVFFSSFSFCRLFFFFVPSFLILSEKTALFSRPFSCFYFSSFLVSPWTCSLTGPPTLLLCPLKRVKHHYAQSLILNLPFEFLAIP